MLQKIIVVVVGLIMSVVGALSPDMIAGKRAGEGGEELAANTADQTLSTLRTSSGDAFARVSVLWIEVDGRRVTEDAWGTGEVEEIRFKVGVKDIEDVALAVGDKIVPLHPTDIITIRMFRGDFSYRSVGTPLASLQLQGVVKTTVLNEGDVGNRVLTRVNELDLKERPAQPGDESRVAYVVLTTGQKVDTVAVEDGGARLFTEEVSSLADAKNEPGNLLAKWVKFDGKLIREYTWGDGGIGKIEFEPAEGTQRSIVLAFNGETFEIGAGERIVIEDFVGEHLVYQVSGGMMRLRLDGYARAYLTADAVPTPQQGGPGAPLAHFDFLPPNPKSTDTVHFRDRSTDDGIIVFRQWDFGDNTSNVLPDPSKRFGRPGSYDVTLSVTDNDLKTTNVTRTIVVRNSDPVSDFDFTPKIVSTDSVVAFTDHSYDADGTLANWTWSFGDGGSAFSRHPTHRFTRAGNVTVTLTTIDELGGRSSLSKVILVRNAPPLASFTYSPGQPISLDPIQFVDNSSDRDGRVVAWNWSFGDGRYGAGSAPVHAYAKPGSYTVTLTVHDDMGDVDTVSTTVGVGNRMPHADFTWTPDNASAGAPMTFTSHSSDPDGNILAARWNFGDAAEVAAGHIVSHTFPRAGKYNVTLTVTDNNLGTNSVMHTVTINNSAPRASMIFSPNPTYRGMEVVFSDTSSDPDGDSIVNTTWDLGDGAVAYGPVVRHTYSVLGSRAVTLTVRDEFGQTASVTRPIQVLNRAPTVGMQFAPRPAAVADNVTFVASGTDPDAPQNELTYLWSFSDGPTATAPTVTRTFNSTGHYTVSVRAADPDGGVSGPRVVSFFVDLATPRVIFNWTPVIPARDQLVTFNDSSWSANGAIREWRWSFGDNTGVMGTRQVSHVYKTNGTFTVKLIVTDSEGRSNVSEQQIVVNLLPLPGFTAPPPPIELGVPVPFNDGSTDPDGVVVAWSWDFGDGRTSTERNPIHPGYTTPGTYPVRLTVTDDRGAQASTTAFVDVANTPPVAEWIRDETGDPIVINESILFNGSARSYDPDGNPLVSYNWTFGDRTPLQRGPSVLHAYRQSGHWTVGLTVWDGARASPTTSLSHREVHVQPLHPVQLVIQARMPDGTYAPIGLPPYSVSVRVAGEELDGSTFDFATSKVEATIPPSAWVHNDSVRVRLSAPFLGVNEWSGTLTDYTEIIFANLTLRMSVGAELVPARGDRVSFLALLGNRPDHYGDPIYSDMFERPHGTGRLAYADGTPAGNMRVDVEARWVPLYQLSNARNDTEAQFSLPNWCRVASATSLANGTFAWTFDGASACYLNSVAGASGLYPAGRWEVRARPQVPSAENKVSPIRAFYVDPTGGIILQAMQGLA